MIHVDLCPPLYCNRCTFYYPADECRWDTEAAEWRCRRCAEEEARHG